MSTNAVLKRAARGEIERAKEFKVALSYKESERMRSLLDGWGPGAVGVIAGNGHSGYGLYLYCPTYPEEGSIFIGGTLT